MDQLELVVVQLHLHLLLKYKETLHKLELPRFLNHQLHHHLILQQNLHHLQQLKLLQV
jgi:hypothetical protein